MKKNDVIEMANLHNKMCEKFWENYEELDWPESVFSNLLQLCLPICCEMRKIGMNAVIDTLTGEVVNGDSVDKDELREDSQRRYMTFEWVKED